MKRFALLCCWFLCLPVDAELTGFSLPDIEGNTHALSDYRGKWVVVNYWATWCPPCLEEIPELVDFHDEHRDRDAVVLGVNFETISASELGEFIDDMFISYPVLLGDAEPVTPLGTVSGLPTTILVSPAGVPVARQVGPVTRDLLESFIARKTTRPGGFAGSGGDQAVPRDAR